MLPVTASAPITLLVGALLSGCSAPSTPATEPGSSSPEPASLSEAARASKEPAPRAPGILLAHNRARALHCAEPLVWSEEVAATAQRWADHVAASCRLQHSTSREYGENLYFAAPSDPASGDRAVESWYSERRAYRFGSGGFSMQTGHFTQVVWRGTRQLGCGKAQCNGGDLWVCSYAPAGNVRGQFRENVLPASCR